MIILGIFILIVLTLILCVLIAFLYHLGHQPPTPIPDSLEEMVNMMKEEKESIDREKRDAELIAYSKKHIKDRPLGMIATTEQSDRPVNVRGTKELIPYGWSEEQKRLWEEFNS